MRLLKGKGKALCDIRVCSELTECMFLKVYFALVGAPEAWLRVLGTVWTCRKNISTL